MFPAPLLPWPWIPHICPITMATSASPTQIGKTKWKPARVKHWLYACTPFEPTPWPRKMPNPVDCADNWIWVQMSWEAWHPCWWRELKALYRGCLVNDLSDTHALQFAQWQATAFSYPLPRKRHQDGGRLHMSLVDCINGTFYPELIPLAKGSSGLLGKNKLWHWPKLCNIVQRGWGCLSKSCVTQHRTFKGVWYS